MDAYKIFVLVLSSVALFSCGGAQNGSTQTTAPPSAHEDSEIPEVSPISDEVALDSDAQWSPENNESNREADVLTPPNSDNTLAFDSDANWSPDGPLLEEENSPNISPVDDDREIPIDSDLNWYKSKS